MHVDVMITEGVGLAFDMTDDGVKSAETKIDGARFVETADNVEMATENRVGLHGCSHVITEDIEFTDDETVDAISPAEVVLSCAWLTHTFWFNNWNIGLTQQRWQLVM